MFTFLMFSIAREKDAYRLVGLILAWSVVHGGPGGKFLCPTLYDSVVYGPDVTNPSLEDVPTRELKEKIQKVSGPSFTLDFSDHLLTSSTFQLRSHNK